MCVTLGDTRQFSQFAGKVNAFAAGMALQRPYGLMRLTVQFEYQPQAIKRDIGQYLGDVFGLWGDQRR